ncbi:hypothetical protein BASA81_006517 [Batrachochytrium salamandrivorans]|nr:hypothetical protein BASA81_006517 [Batrachochytrium salamandrivorans]
MGLFMVLGLFAGVLLSSYADFYHLFLCITLSISFPALASSCNAELATVKKQAIVLVALLSWIELVPPVGYTTQQLQIAACILASNLGVFMQSSSTARLVVAEEEDRSIVQPQAPVAPPPVAVVIASPQPVVTTASPQPVVTTASPQPVVTTASPQPVVTTASPQPVVTTASPQPVVTTASPPPIAAVAAPPPPIAAVAAPPQPIAAKSENNSLLFAAKGDGQGEDCTPEQVALIQSVYAQTRTNALFTKHPELNEYFTLETCRRYLVARQWNEKKAIKQLEDSLEFNAKQMPWKLTLFESPACVDNPYALSMRMVGFDHIGRPMIMAEFRHALARSNASLNVTHFERVVETTRRVVAGRFQAGITTEAKQLQWVLIVNFPGFGYQDLSLRTASECVKLLAHFPEFLGLAALVDAPTLFSGAWATINSLLDDRVRQKVLFVSSKDVGRVLGPKIGPKKTAWLEIELRSLNSHNTKLQGKRAYWEPIGDHDPRGEPEYVHSEWYIKTPGDAWKERQH